MTNLHSLKKKRVRIGKMIVQAREERASRSFINHLEQARENVKYKIQELRKKKKPKDKLKRRKK